MPRIAKPATSQTEAVRSALKSYLEQKNISAVKLAEGAGVKQCTLSRFVSGRTKSVTPAIRPALDYALIDENKCISEMPTPLDNARMRDALAKVWDGTPESAEMLAGLIEVVGPLVTRHLRHNARSSS